MKENFSVAMKPLMQHEGGFSNDKSDPGGATYKGVTHRTYDSFRTSHGLPTQDVRRMTEAEKLQIYKENYWDEVKGDKLPSGLDYCVFDAAVNSGPSQAVKWLQRALKAQSLYEGMVDGNPGTGTVAGAKRAITKQLINSICDQRLAFMRTLKNWPNARGGWTKRVADVRRISLSMVGIGDAEDVPLPLATALEAEESPKAYATNTKATETPEGKLGTQQLGIGGGGLITFLLSKFDVVSDHLSLLTGMDPATAKILINGLVILAFISMVGFCAYSLIQVIQRRKHGEEMEAN